jgi:hypothetical protein
LNKDVEIFVLFTKFNSTMVLVILHCTGIRPTNEYVCVCKIIVKCTLILNYCRGQYERVNSQRGAINLCLCDIYDFLTSVYLFDCFLHTCTQYIHVHIRHTHCIFTTLWR